VLLVVVPAGTVVTPAPASGQAVLCDDSMTLVACYRTHRESIDTAFVRQNREREEAQLRGKTSGTPAVGAASAISDFLPLLAGTLGLRPVEADEEGALAFETHVGLPTGGVAEQRFRLRATVRTARVYQPLQVRLADDLRESVVRAAEEGFGAADDIELGVAWNRESPSMGRSFRSYQVLYGRLLDDVLADLPDEPPEALTELLLEAAADCPVEPTVGCLSEDRRDAVVAQLRTLAEADALFGPRAAEAARESRLDWFGRLVNNQPQLSVEASGRFRSADWVGPHTYSLGIRYEYGLQNVNALRGFCADSGSAVVGVECLRSYLDRPGVRASVDRGDRLWGSIRYQQTEPYSATLDTAVIDQAATWDLVAEAGYGAYLGTNPAGDEMGRIDASFEAHLVNDDSGQRENRVVFNLDVTRRLGDGVSLALGISAANKPRFVGEEGKKVAVRAGLRYGLQ
jgi:hypothetical protein